MKKYLIKLIYLFFFMTFAATYVYAAQLPASGGATAGAAPVPPTPRLPHWHSIATPHTKIETSCCLYSFPPAPPRSATPPKNDSESIHPPPRRAVSSLPVPPTVRCPSDLILLQPVNPLQVPVVPFPGLSLCVPEAIPTGL